MRGGTLAVLALVVLLIQKRQRPARAGRWFSWAEVYEPGVAGSPSTDANAVELAAEADQVREFIDQPIGITDWHRTAEHNDDVGGADGSKHLIAAALDAVSDGYTSEDLARAWLDSGARFHKLIWYPSPDPHLHVSINPGGDWLGQVLRHYGPGDYRPEMPREVTA
ncbi:MAG: hypothetical protein K0U52_10460 [Gammaproteobacteria bacterium]|nr:hypothetical protein [Gammaproteobacteria bacterium]